MLELKDVDVIFNKGTIHEKKALSSFDLTLEQGDFVTIIGSNGAGKSTLFQAISGGVTLDKGKILLNHQEIQNLPEYKRACHIGRLFQDPLKGTAPSLTIEENLALASQRGKHFTFSFSSYKKRAEFKKALMELELGLETRLNSKVGLLSGGQRQALTLLMAIYTTPQLLLLDEHTAALDPKTAKKVMDITVQEVAKHQITTLMITHNMEDALKYGNKTLIMKDGQIVALLDEKAKKKMSVEDLILLYSSKTQEWTDKLLLRDNDAA